jgi:UTP:GlnB (protein PII) uridylyltransferase
VSRGDVHQGSDLDLILVGDFSGSRRDRVDQVLEVAWDLGVRRGVEPLVYTPEEFERAKLSPDFAALLAEARDVTPAQSPALRPS